MNHVKRFAWTPHAMGHDDTNGQWISIEDHDCIVADLSDQIDFWRQGDFVEMHETLATQKRVIEKLKDQYDFIFGLIMNTRDGTKPAQDLYAKNKAEIEALEDLEKRVREVEIGK